MATTVQIELRVDESGAVSGVRAFESQLKGATGTVQKFGAEVKRAFAPPPFRASSWVREVDEVGKHALTSLDNVRLLRDDLGIRIPRSMEKAIAQSRVLSTAIGGIGQGLLALGALQIGFALFKEMSDGLTKLWNEHISLTKAASDYREEVEKTRQQEFGNSDSIETTTLRINQATEAIKTFHDQSQKVANSTVPITWRRLIPFVGASLDVYKQRSEAHDLEGKSVEAQQQRDKLTNVEEPKEYHETRVASIELAHARDAELVGIKKINAELAKKVELQFEDRRYAGEKQRIIGNPEAADAGAKAGADANEIARREAEAQTFLLNKEHAQELMRLRAQATEAGLRGSALYAAQESAAIAELKFKDMDSIAARSAIHLRFHNEEMRRLEDQQRETKKIQDETRLAGLTGIAHIQQAGENRVSEVSADPTLDPAERDKRIAALREATAAEVGAKQLEWAKRVDEVVAQSADRQVSGFARIRAEADKAKADLERQFEEAHSQMNLAAPGAQQAYNADSAKLGTGLSAIDRGADYQSAQMAEKNAQETLQIEQEARRKSLSDMKQQTAAINAEYNERLSKYQEQLRQQEISEDDYNRRVAAAGEERNAEMVEASKAAHEKMAGEFDSLFKSLDHPLKALAGLGEKVASEAAATLVQKLQAHAGKSTADSPGKGGPGGFIAGLLNGSGFGGFGGGKKSSGDTSALASSIPVSAAHPEASATGRVFSVSSAMISVGSASIAFGGMTPSGSVPGSVGGGTGLLHSRISGGGTASSSGFGGGSGGGFTSSPSGFSGGSGESSYGGYASSSADSSSFSGGGATGGAGASSVGGAISFAGPTGDIPQKKSGFGGVMSDVSQGISFAKKAGSIFGGGGGASGSDAGGISASADDSNGPGWSSSTTGIDAGSSSAGNGGMLGGGGVGANAGGAISGGLGLFSAYEGNGGVGGALQGGLAGMQLGMAVGGPIGAAIGAVGGAVIGAIGFGGREKARVYDLKTVRPQITSDTDSFQQGSMDYMTAFSNLQATDWQARNATGQMGPAAHDYYNDTIAKELKTAEARLTQEQKAGRSMYTASAAQYDIGTDSVPRDGMAMIHENERIMPSDQNERITRAIESSASTHASYQSTMQSRDARSGSGGDRTMNMNVHAIDSRGVAQFLDKYKHHIKAAVNGASAENSGGGIA